MGNKITVYKAVRSDYGDMRGINFFHPNTNKEVVDNNPSKKQGISFSWDPVEVLSWLNSKEEWPRRIKVVLLEIDEGDVFLSFPNENPAVKKCRVIREMNVFDIISYIQSEDFEKKKYTSSKVFKRMKETNSKYWKELRENIQVFSKYHSKKNLSREPRRER